MQRAVLLAGGWAHPGDDLIAAMQVLLGTRSFAVAVVTEPAAVAREVEGGCDLLVVGCCWFPLADDRYTDEQRRKFGVAFDGALRDAIESLIAAGCPVLAMHTAVISFDGAQSWANLLGGTWNWTASWHPEPAPMAVQPGSGTPIAFDAFSVVDELYQDLDVSDTAMVVAESEKGDPLVWVHKGPGRAAVNLLGHDRRSLLDPAHQQLNERLLDWLLET